MCSCTQTNLCRTHHKDIRNRLDHINEIRKAAGGKDTVYTDREMAFLRIDYGRDAVDAVIAENA